MDKIKRRTMLIAVVAILFVFMTQPTVAYYTTIGTATNVVTSGSIQLQIREQIGHGIVGAGFKNEFARIAAIAHIAVGSKGGGGKSQQQHKAQHQDDHTVHMLHAVPPYSAGQPEASQGKSAGLFSL